MLKENIAVTIADWTQSEADRGKMLPKTTKEILTELSEGRGYVLPDSEGAPIAYCRYLVWSPELIEVGSTVVDPNPGEGKRRKGAGTRVTLETITMAHTKLLSARIIGLTENPDSEAMITKMGGVVKEKSAIDPVVWELCAKPGQECSHLGEFPDCPCTLFDLTHLAYNDK
jgi:hypothetical protein